MAWVIEEGTGDATLDKLVAVIVDANVDVLRIVLDDARLNFLNMTHLDVVPDEAEPLVRQLATIAYNRLGSEGLASESYAGVSQSFVDGLPDDLRREVNTFRTVKW